MVLKIALHRSTNSSLLNFPHLPLADPAPMNIADVQTLLTADEALVFYYTAYDPPLVWAITREGVAWQQSDMARHTLAHKLSMLRSGLDCPASTSDCSAPALRFDLGLAHELYRTL